MCVKSWKFLSHIISSGSVHSQQRDVMFVSAASLCVVLEIMCCPLKKKSTTSPFDATEIRRSSYGWYSSHRIHLWSTYMNGLVFMDPSWGWYLFNPLKKITSPSTSHTKNLGPNKHLHQPPTNIPFFDIHTSPSRRPKRCPKRRRVVLCVHRILHYFDLNKTASGSFRWVFCWKFWWKVNGSVGYNQPQYTPSISIGERNSWILTIDQ